VKNAFGILCQTFQIYLKTTLQSLLENSDIISVTCILQNYLRDQGIDQSDTASFANVQTILKIYKTKEEVPTKVLLK